MQSAGRIAFIKSIPILCSYIFLGAVYGIMMQKAGYSWLVTLLISCFIYTGAFQFVLITFLANHSPLLTLALTALLMNSRQIFYSLTFVEDFNNMGSKKLYMIHSMTDETYAVNCTMSDIEPKRRRQIMFPLAIMCHIYWMAGSMLGILAGILLGGIALDGIDFCMTALFVIIAIDQWERTADHMPAIVGLLSGIACLLIFGKTNFMLPALLAVSAILLFNKRVRVEDGR